MPLISSCHGSHGERGRSCGVCAAGRAHDRTRLARRSAPGSGACPATPRASERKTLQQCLTFSTVHIVAPSAGWRPQPPNASVSATQPVPQLYCSFRRHIPATDAVYCCERPDQLAGIVYVACTAAATIKSEARASCDGLRPSRRPPLKRMRRALCVLWLRACLVCSHAAPGNPQL